MDTFFSKVYSYFVKNTQISIGSEQSNCVRWVKHHEFEKLRDSDGRSEKVSEQYNEI